MRKIIVVGSGGHAKVIIDILNEMNLLSLDIEIVGITSNSLNSLDSFYGYRVLGDDDVLKNYIGFKGYYVAIGLGGYSDNLLREKIFRYVKSLGFNFINVIHPSAVISKTVRLSEGIVVFPGVVINTDSVIGSNSIVATGSTIDHETEVGCNVLISAGVTIGAYAKIGEGSLLALGSKVISGVNIGKNVLVAAGAVVVNDISDNKKVFGIPAKAKL